MGSPPNGSHVAPAFANGSNKGPAPHAPEDPLAALAATYSTAPAASAHHMPLAHSASDSMFDPMGSFGGGMLARRPSNNNKLFLAIGAAAVAVVAVVVIIASTGGSKSSKTAAADTGTKPAAAEVVPGDQNTGFDLYVSPSGTMTWRLDGEARTDRLPSRIRGISPGAHTVAIDAPAGFMSQNMPINVEMGKAPKVEITLQPLDIAGSFTSTPPGATVSLIVDGKREALGPSPAKAKLDPRKTYQVLFEKPGFVSVNRPIVFTGGLEEPIEVTLEKAGGAAVAAIPPTNTEARAAIEPAHVEKKTTRSEKVAKAVAPEKADRPEKTEKVEPKVEKTPEVKEAAAEVKGTGTLLLGSKPPCEIFIDGKSTGLSTPQRDIKLSAGKHKVTLVNNEFGITEKFVVEIKADAVEKQIKDYSDRLPK
jgi:hypothetical protein